MPVVSVSCYATEAFVNKYINVKIPSVLLTKIIYVLEHIDIDVYAPGLKNDYNNVLFQLYDKRYALELRDAYIRIVNAKNDESRHFARMQYLKKRGGTYDA